MARTKLPTRDAPSVGVTGSDPKSRWWREPDALSMGAGMVARAKRIEQSQHGRHDELIVFASLYANRRMTSLYQFGTTRPGMMAPTFDVLGHRVTWNVAQSCVDTLAAKIAKNKARVMFQTFDGNFTQKRKARQLTKFVDGLFYEGNVYDAISEPCFLDASVFDAGIAQVIFDDDEEAITFDRVLPIELLVDDTDAIYGAPRTIYRRKYYARDVLAERFARKGKDAIQTRDVIESAAGLDPLTSGRIPDLAGLSDMVAVFEAWHLPSGPKADDGVHVIALEGATLFSEPYTKTHFPFAKYVDTPLPCGYWGQGVVAQVVGIQIEVNKLLRAIQRAQHLMSVPRWLVQVGSQMVPEHLNNDFGSIAKYAGDKPPQPFVAQAMSPEVYQHVQTLYTKAFEITGISALSATGAKPAGLDAGVALREYHDIESERFVKKGQRFETFHLDLARIAIDIARDAYAKGKSVKVRAPMSRLVEAIDWKDIAMDDDAYVMRAFPTSILPSTPAGKLQRVQELVDAQIIPRERALALLDMPDLDSEMSAEVAAYRDVERTIENVLEHGKYETPEPFQDLALLVKLGQSSYLKARADNVPPERLDMLARLVDEADGMIKSLTAPPPGAMPAGPPGMGVTAPPGLPAGGPIGPLPPGLPPPPGAPLSAADAPLSPMGAENVG